jgi:hypothetical protein
MTFSQQSDVQKHLARPVKKSHYLTPSEPQATAEKTEQGSAGGSATLLDDREPILVTKK